MPLCALHISLMLLHTDRGSAGRLLSKALLLMVDHCQSQMVSHLLGTLHHMLPAWHIAPLVHRFGTSSSDGKAWPEPPRCSGAILSGAGMLPASCTFPLQSTNTMLSPTLEVSRLLSAFSAAFTSRYIHHAAACLIFPLRMREARFAIKFHVPSLIQSFPIARVCLGLMHLAASASKRVEFATIWFRWKGGISGVRANPFSAIPSFPPECS